ncbi:MAG: MFS transporter [Pseudomonadota bacterium]|nr:MFS transporter [Pseudomonadota bacterium]
MKNTWRTPMVVLTCGTIILFISFGARNIFGILLDPMTESAGLSVGDFSFAIGLQAVIWGLTTPITASLAERFGTGRMIAIGGVLYAGGLILMSLVQTPMHMNLTAGLMLGLGLSATGFPIILAAITKRVDAKRRSLFLGIGSAAGSSGQLALVPMGQFFINGYGWAITAIVFGCLVALIVPLATAMKDETRGSAVSGAAPAQKLTDAIGEAMAHRGFLLLTAGYFVCGYQVMFLGTHLPNFLSEAGQDPWVGATALSLIGLFNILGTLFWGAMGGRWRMKYLLTSIYLLRSLVLAIFILLPVTPWSTYIFAAAIGLLWLATVPLTSGLVARIFGLRYMATLTGIVFFSHQLGSFVGAWLGGVFFESTGSYDTIWWVGILLGIIAAALHFPIDDKPVERLQPAGA